MIRFATVFFALVFWASMAFAGPDDSFGKALMARIKSEGFRIEAIKTTFLRRIQIDSNNNRKRRQTVYNPVTGVILRDLIFPIDETGFLSHVTEILGVDLRSRRSGRKDKGNGKIKIGMPEGKNGKFISKGQSRNNNAGTGRPN